MSTNEEPRSNITLAERLSAPLSLSLIDRIASSPTVTVSREGSPISTDSETQASPTETLIFDPLGPSVSPLRQFPTGHRAVHELIPYDERTPARVTESIGYVFNRSLQDDTHRSPSDPVTCRVRGRGGQETMFYDPQEVSPLTRPFNARRFNLELINRLGRPSVPNVRNEVIIEPGQLVWMYIYQLLTNGWTVDFDPRGPFIVVAKSGSRCVLIDAGGFLHPTPVSIHRLIPAVTTWHAMRIPMELRNHEDVQEILTAWNVQPEGL